jgi:hypothetical protein
MKSNSLYTTIGALRDSIGNARYSQIVVRNFENTIISAEMSLQVSQRGEGINQRSG